MSCLGNPRTSSCLNYDFPRWVPFTGNTRNFLVIHLQTTLPSPEKQLIKIKDSSRRNYTTVYVGLTPELVKKVENLAENQKRSGSETLRQILDLYFKIIEKNNLPNEPLRKISPIGLKVLPRTITKEQDKKLRELAERTGHKISEIVREAVETVKTEDVLSLKREKVKINDSRRSITNRGSL